MILLPNGKLVTGSYDKTIKIWPDPAKFDNLNTTNLQLSQISSASSKKASILNPIKTLTGHTSCIIALKYLNDGANFASGSADYSIKVLDMERGENIKNFTGHMSDILSVQKYAATLDLVTGEAHDGHEQGGLAGTVGSEEHRGVAGHDVQ